MKLFADDPMIPGVMMAFMGIFYAGMGAGAPKPREAKWSTGENLGEIWGKTSGFFSVVRSFVCWFVVLLRFWSDIEIEPQYLRCFTQKICGVSWVKNSADPSNAWRDFSWGWKWVSNGSASRHLTKPTSLESCWIMLNHVSNQLKPSQTILNNLKSSYMICAYLLCRIIYHELPKITSTLIVEYDL